MTKTPLNSLDEGRTWCQNRDPGEIQIKSSLSDPNTTSENIHLQQGLQQCRTVSQKKWQIPQAQIVKKKKRLEKLWKDEDILYDYMAKISKK